MKLRTKLTVGMIVLFTITLGIFCGTMIYSNYQMQEKETLAYTLGEAKSVCRQISSEKLYSVHTVSEGAKESFYKYVFSEIARTSSAGSEFVLQGTDEDLFNNSGIDAKSVLEQYGKELEIPESHNGYRGTVIFWEGQYYCIVGFDREFDRTDSQVPSYFISVVRNITDNMNQVKRLGLFYVGTGFFLLILSGVGAYFYLKKSLYPLQNLQMDANAIAEKYTVSETDRDEDSLWAGHDRKDEVESLKNSFAQMQETVEVHIEEVEKKVEEQKMLISALAHEMRTPVTAITGYAYALNHAELTREQRKEATEFVDSESRRLERLSTKLAQLISMEHHAFEFEKIDIHGFGEKIEQTLQPKAEKWKVDFTVLDKVLEKGREDDTVSGKEETCWHGDRDLLMVLVTNLFDNACKAGATKIMITLGENEIQVADNGSGMTESELDKIMQPFYQGDASRKREGFGLGLAICKRIVDLHGAEIVVQSEPGKGSQFVVQM